MPDTAKLFRNGQSQAVRLPRKFRFDEGDEEVYISRVGDMVILLPRKGNRWQNLIDAVEEFSPDLELRREQDLPDSRETVFP